MRKAFSILIIALSINAFSQIPTDGLVGHYPFAGHANDLSGEGNHSSMNNGATFTTDRFGNINNATLLDGKNDFISFRAGNSTSLNITGDLAVSFWIKTTINQASLISFGDNNTPDTDTAGYISGLGSNGAGNGKLGVALGNGWNSATNTTLNDNNWHHILYQLKTDTLQIYIDNILETEVTGVSAPLSWKGNRIFGCRSDLDMSAGVYAGAFDDLRIYNRALSFEERRFIHHEGVYYKFISVTDTLIINANITNFKPVAYQNSIKIYPNPTSDQITIDFGNNYDTMDGYELKVMNSLSQVVYSTSINLNKTNVDLSSWTGHGIYFIHLINNNGHTIDVKKIILQ